MKKLFSIMSIVAITTSATFGMGMGGEMGDTPKAMKQQMSPDMQLKLDFDYLVNLPILMRSVFKNSDNAKLALTKEQKIAIKKHKIEVMDSISDAMKSSHKLSMELKNGLLYGDKSEKELFELSAEIAKQKEQVLAMKITCIKFIRATLSAEQFKTLLELDKQMPYKNNPYNY